MTRNENQRPVYLFVLLRELQILNKDKARCSKLTSAQLFMRDTDHVDSHTCHPPALGQKVITAACQRPQKDCCPMLCLVILISGYVLLVGGRGSSRES